MAGPADVIVRPGHAGELETLAAVADEAAAPRRAQGCISLPRLAASHAEGLLWTAADGADRPVGFAAGTIADNNLHVVAIMIARAHQGRGIGRALMERAIDHGRWAFFPAVTVTADAAAPLFRRLGFVALDSNRLPPDLDAFLRAERNAVSDAERIVMAKVL